MQHQPHLTSRSVRTLADRIQQAFPGADKPRALEVIAHAFGYRDFNTLSGLLKKAEQALGETEASPAALQPAICTSLCTSEPFDLWIACFSVHEYGESPDWVRLRVDQKFLDALLALRTMVVELDLRFAAQDVVVADYDNDAGNGSCFNCHAWDLYVSPNRFWLRTLPKHAEIAVESRAIDFDDLAKLLDQKSGREAGDETFRWIEGALFKDGCDAEALHETTCPASEDDADDDVEDVVEQLMRMRDKHDCNYDEDDVRESVLEAAEFLGLSLNEAQICDACDKVLQAVQGDQED